MTIAAPTRFLLPAVLLVSAAALGACSSGNDDGGPPSGNTESPAAASAAEKSEVAANALQEGDCMTDSGTAARPAIQVIPCGEPHGFEVYATTELPAGEYPGTGEADAQAQEFCRGEFTEFVGLEYDASALDLQYFYPVEAEWADDGGRSVICLVGAPGGEPSSGTLRDANQ